MQDPFELIHNNQIEMYEASKKEICLSCNGTIFRTDIAVKNMHNAAMLKEKYHLHCFRPLFDTPIKEDNIRLSIKESINKNKINNWIRTWNWTFRLKDPLACNFTTPLPRKLTLENIGQNVLSPLGKQNIINILSFLTIDEILYLVKPVSKNLYEICWSSHLWKKLCVRDYTKKATSDAKKSKKDVVWPQEYFRFQKTICFVCKKRSASNLKSCPIENKPICGNCRLKPDFKLLNLDDISTQYGAVLGHIFKNFIEKYTITCFGEKVFYKRDVENAFKSYQNFSGKEKV